MIDCGQLEILAEVLFFVIKRVTVSIPSVVTTFTSEGINHTTSSKPNLGQSGGKLVTVNIKCYRSLITLK